MDLFSAKFFFPLLFVLAAATVVAIVTTHALEDGSDTPEQMLKENPLHLNHCLPLNFLMNSSCRKVLLEGHESRAAPHMVLMMTLTRGLMLPPWNQQNVYPTRLLTTGTRFSVLVGMLDADVVSFSETRHLVIGLGECSTLVGLVSDVKASKMIMYDFCCLA